MKTKSIILIISILFTYSYSLNDSLIDNFEKSANIYSFSLSNSANVNLKTPVVDYSSTWLNLSFEKFVIRYLSIQSSLILNHLLVRDHEDLYVGYFYPTIGIGFTKYIPVGNPCLFDFGAALNIHPFIISYPDDTYDISLLSADIHAEYIHFISKAVALSINESIYISEYTSLSNVNLHTWIGIKYFIPSKSKTIKF